MTADPEVRLRADARRNRDQIIAAAKAMFAEIGPEVPMDEIARHAGVGVGTLYRRFPDREALIRSVARDNFAEVLIEAEAAEAEEPTAWEALVRLLRRSRALRLTVRLALLSPEVWATMRDDADVRRFRAEILAILDRIVRGAQEEGALRRDVGAGDVAVLVSLLLKRIPAAADVTEMVADRVFALILDALRAEAATPLPGRILTADDLRTD
ncbi:TetR/AcrR family transcriptional regulator [Amycolatopsis alkalitolerans]|uniref:TetR/AcrR family transcriptional regulator n=1 Tax=Amycolatopsis alkalitolerans TaxID=2547244 RepID=A0A5C4LUR9_9PSEU|nr:TetR/AcrR family transcriptional regulator [Amycolatopsis alkalitolerans]TNC21659.1 TetR/AcrR family transcriptional regulator [Amycolatopsis alkalitolerans]